MHVHGGCPASLQGHLLCRPLCTQMNGVVVVDVPAFVHPADDDMQMRYAASGFFMQPYGGLAARHIGLAGYDFSVLVADSLPVECRCKVFPQLLPVIDCKISGMLHGRAYLHTDDVVLYVGMIHGGKFHFRPDTRRVHALRHEIVAYPCYLFGMLLVLRFTRHI